MGFFGKNNKTKTKQGGRMFYGQVSSEKLHSLWKGHKSQWLIKGVKSPAIRKLFIFVKVIVSPNLTDQKQLLLFYFFSPNSMLLTVRGTH